jgi:hypothetical protein
MTSRSATAFFLTILAIALATVIYAPKIFVTQSNTLSKNLKEISAQNANNQPIPSPQGQPKKLVIQGRVLSKKVKANPADNPPSQINALKIAESKRIENIESNGRSPKPKNSPCQVTLSEKALQDTLIKNFLDRYQCSAN